MCKACSIIHYSLSLTGCGWRMKHWKNFLFPRARVPNIYNSTSPFATLATNRTPQGGIHGNSKIKNHNSFIIIKGIDKIKTVLI